MTERTPILFVGPYPPPFGGIANNTRLLLNSDLSHAFRIDFLNTLSRKRVMIRLHKRGLYSLGMVVVNFCKLFLNLARGNHRLVYFKATSDLSFFREVLFLYLAKAFGKRTVLHFHGSQYHAFFSGRSRICNRVFAWGIRPADVVVFLSDNLRRAFAGMVGRPQTRYEVINNVVQTRVFKSVDASPKGQTSPVKILFVGRLTRQKGLWDILEILPRFKGAYPPALFVFGGVGESEEEEQAIQAFCRENGLTDFVQFLGRIDGDAKVKTFLESDIFLFPSHEEIFPNVLLEALASGLPVVSTRVVCIPEIIEDGENGYIVEPGDQDALYERVATLLEDAELRDRMSRANLKRAASKYDLSVAVLQLSEIFSRLIHEKGMGKPE